jgi:hypothetical protein
MGARATEAEAPSAAARIARDPDRTHPRVQVVPLCLCAAASAGVAAATRLPWFGSISGDPTAPEYSAVSPVLRSPNVPAGLLPGTQGWGWLLVAWSALLAVTAVVAAVACAARGARHARGVRRLLLGVGVGSLVLVALVASELTGRVQFDLVSFVGFDWGELVGLGLALASSFCAWFAWATFVYPHRWGLAASAA